MTAAPSPTYSARSASFRPSAIREILKVTEQPEVISFAGGLPAPELFPVAEMAAAASEVLAEDGPAALQYGPTEGHGPLRQWVSRHLRDTCNLDIAAEQLLVTAGSQQGLDLLGKVFLDPGDWVAAENPSYLGALQAFRAYEAQIAGIPGDSEGMDPVALQHWLESFGGGNARHGRPKILYLIPNFQNPTGSSTTTERRRLLAAVAATHGLLVVEDDPYGALRFDGAARPALCALPEAGACVYLGTASKLISPGLRVAWLATRETTLFERLVVAKQSSDLHTSSLTQRIVERFVRSPGRLESHLARLRTVYRERRDAMVAALERHLPRGSRWTRPEGGLFLWVRLSSGIDTSAILDEALRRKVAFVPGAPFWIDRDERSTLRLNFSNASPERIEEGVRRLGEVLRERRNMSTGG